MKQYRVYSFVGQKLLFLGMTIGELLTVVISLLAVVSCDAWLLKLSSLIAGFSGVVLNRKLRKVYRGTAFTSYVYWFTGVIPKRSVWVPSHKRQWWCR